MTDRTTSTATAAAEPATAITSILMAPSLLLANGALLALTIIIARLATGHGAPMLWFLTWVMTGAGLILLFAAFATGNATGGWRRRTIYSIGAGAFQAATMAMAFLSVGYVGAGYISLVFAFPLLATYALALAVRMERFSALRTLGVTVGLMGGLMIASAKFTGLAGVENVGWVLVATAIPLVISAGNLYRTKFWPGDAPPVLLAALMLLFAAAITGPVAAVTESIAALSHPLSDPTLLTLTGLNIAAFALKFVVYFKLQRTAGPVYLSQIGSVGAAFGIPVSVLLLGESLPDGFAIAALLVVAGAVLFQLSQKPAK
ncbi:MAG: EamA/RhaT family transporter [Alphaproteobacteria bacterium]